MNYTELTQAIQDYTENTETSFVANIPTFVRQAEEKILRQVLIPELRKLLLVVQLLTLSILLGRQT